MVRALLTASLLSLALVGTANAQTVRDKKTCQQAVTDARNAVAEGSVSEKARAEANQLVQIADHLCTQANFVFAENALAVARGMVAEE